MSLEDEIRLAGEPEARVFEMREHGFGGVPGKPQAWRVAGECLNLPWGGEGGKRY
jgi:hypothetical protein